MFIRKMALVVATAALGLTAGVGSASATTLFTDPGNVPFATGNVTIKNTTSGTATLTTSIGNLSCATTHFQATVNNNHAATLAGSLSQLTFTNCTDTIPILTISSCHLHGASPAVAVTANSAGTGGSVNLTDVGVRCAFTSGGACYFTAATAAGTANNAASTISYTGVGAVRITGTSDNLGNLCPASGTFSTVLNHIVQAGTNETVTIRP